VTASSQGVRRDYTGTARYTDCSLLRTVECSRQGQNQEPGQTAVVLEPYGYTVVLINLKTRHVLPPITVGA
jgi:hypothetical protein